MNQDPLLTSWIIRLYLWVSSLFSGAKEKLNFTLEPTGATPYRTPGVAEELPKAEKINKPGWLARLKNWRPNVTWKYSLEDTFWYLIIAAIISSIVGVGLYAGLGASFASGKVDYCYVEHFTYKEKATDRDKDKANADGQIERDLYKLKGHIPWRMDRELAGYPTLGEAVKAAEVLQCPVK